MITIDPNDETISNGKTSRRLPPIVFAIMRTLIAAKGGFVTSDEMIELLPNAGSRADDKKCLHVHMWRVRGAAKALGIVVETTMARATGSRRLNSRWLTNECQTDAR